MSSPVSPRIPVILADEHTDSNTEVIYPLIEWVRNGAQSFQELSDYLVQHSNQIPSEGEGGFGHAVLMAISARNYPALQLIVMQYPVKFQGIPTDEEYGLGQALLLEIEHLNHAYNDHRRSMNFRFLDALLTHPRTHLVALDVPGVLGSDDFVSGDIDIEQTGDTMHFSTPLFCLLVNTLRYEADPRVTSLLRSPLMQLVPPNGPDGLGRILAYAALLRSNCIAVQNLLSLPQARRVTSDPQENARQMSEYFLKQYGFTEAIFLATINTNLSEVDTVTMINIIASFAPQPLRIEDDFGLEYTLNLAESMDYPLVIDRLESLIDEIEENN